MRTECPAKLFAHREPLPVRCERTLESAENAFGEPGVCACIREAVNQVLLETHACIRLQDKFGVVFSLGNGVHADTIPPSRQSRDSRVSPHPPPPRLTGADAGIAEPAAHKHRDGLLASRLLLGVANLAVIRKRLTLRNRRSRLEPAVRPRSDHRPGRSIASAAAPITAVPIHPSATRVRLAV